MTPFPHALGIRVYRAEGLGVSGFMVMGLGMNFIRFRSEPPGFLRVSGLRLRDARFRDPRCCPGAITEAKV